MYVEILTIIYKNLNQNDNMPKNYYRSHKTIIQFKKYETNKIFNQ